MSFGQGGPQWGPGGSGSQTPDWAALAEASAARARRRRLLWIGGGAVATVAVGVAVAAVVVSANGNSAASADLPDGKLPAAQTLPSDSSGPTPSFPEAKPRPVPEPSEFLNSAAKDKAPLSAAGLFPGSSLTVGEQVYKKGPLASTANCASATQGALGQVLSSGGCRQLMRATYSLDGVAVTVGVAVFDTDKAASAAKERQHGGNVASLSGSGVPTFCRATVCRSTTNAVGRYLYVTTGGFTSGKGVTKGDAPVFRAGDDIARFAFRQIYRRGEAQASAAATAAP
ncbi:hypothetical protein [Streptomyces tsukubensis]|uniref:Uncharacterized protein n=1 Tax=Streptomyces tsukubensis TaxID=83656 RepID=A0A1V4A3G5_9ACTN|nr:hypothetical protein [Streptomyces tsukubensis]OON74206.1 hypothetical protein B1H18_25760 [Streptomyces tsukubensis]QFR95273.1 hypothetical protein GBW32_22425 [Streptomyces tsukubensis]